MIFEAIYVAKNNGCNRFSFEISNDIVNIQYSEDLFCHTPRKKIGITFSLSRIGYVVMYVFMEKKGHS